MRLPVRLVGNKALKFRLTFQILLSSNGLTSHAGVFREARIFAEGRNTSSPKNASLSIRRFWGKRGKMEAKKGEILRLLKTPACEATNGREKRKETLFSRDL